MPEHIVFNRGGRCVCEQTNVVCNQIADISRNHMNWLTTNGASVTELRAVAGYLASEVDMAALMVVWKVVRQDFVEFDIPPLSRVSNKVDVLFKDAEVISKG